MNPSELPYSICHPITVKGPDGYYYTFYLKRNVSRAGELYDLWSPYWNTSSEVVIPKMATPPCWFKKAKGIYNYAGSGYPSASLVYKPSFGCLVYLKHTAKDCYHNASYVGGTSYHANPTYYVPRVSNMDFEQEEHSFAPLYEAINPSITRIEGTNTAIMTFWTIVAPYGLRFDGSNNYWFIDLDKSQICYYDIWTDTYRDVYTGQILARETVTAVLCSAVIEWREVAQLKTMWDKGDQKVLIPLVTKVAILDFGDGPKLDISAGGGGSASYDGPFKLSLVVDDSNSNTGTGTTTTVTTKIQCSGGYCRVNGRVRSVSPMELPITNFNANSVYEILLHYNQVINSSGSVSSYSFELLKDTRIYDNTDRNAYCHLGRLSRGSIIEQYSYGCPDLFTFQTDC